MRGPDCKLYYLSTGDRASWDSPGPAPASLTEVPSVQDLTLDGSRDTASTSDRGSDWATEEVGQMATSLSFKMSSSRTDAGRDAIIDAYYSGDVIALAILDGDSAVADVKGLWADFKVTSLQESQPLAGAVEYDVSLTPYQSGVDPERVVVTAA